MEIINERIKQAIDESGVSQAKIASALKINQSNISDYVRGKSQPSLDTLAKLCIFLDLDANYILGVTDVFGNKKDL